MRLLLKKVIRNFSGHLCYSILLKPKCWYVYILYFVLSDSAFNTTDKRGVYKHEYSDTTDYFDNPALVRDVEGEGNYDNRRRQYQKGVSADRLGGNNDDEMNYSTIEGLSASL